MQFDKFDDAENMTILFQTYNPKYPNKAFLVPKSMEVIPNITVIFVVVAVVVFLRNFKLTTQNYTNKAFLVPKLKIFVYL